MKKTLICVVVAMILSASPIYGTPYTLDFEDLYQGSENIAAIPAGYAGFQWTSQAWWMAHEYYGTFNNGYDYGTMGDVAIYAGSGQSISMYGGPTFDFLGAYITSAWIADLDVTVQGYSSGSLIYTTTITTSNDQAYWFDFEFYGIDRLRFTPIGSTNNENIVIDNMIIPEPATIILFGAAIPLLLRRRQSS